jgi:hypothetical protein
MYSVPVLIHDRLALIAEKLPLTFKLTTAFIRPFLIANHSLARTFPVLPLLHRCLAVCRNQASSEFLNDVRLPAQSLVRPLPCSQASYLASGEGWEVLLRHHGFGCIPLRNTGEGKAEIGESADKFSGQVTGGRGREPGRAEFTARVYVTASTIQSPANHCHRLAYGVL